MQLDVLADGDIGNSVSMAAGEFGNGAQLVGAQQTVGDPDSHHEALQCPAFPALTAGYARPVTLGVHTPPAKIGPNPFRWNGVKPLAREASDFLQTLPWVLGALEAFDSLRFGFLRCVCHKILARLLVPNCFVPENKKPTAGFVWRWVISAGFKNPLVRHPPCARAHACTTTTRAHAHRAKIPLQHDQ